MVTAGKAEPGMVVQVAGTAAGAARPRVGKFKLAMPPTFDDPHEEQRYRKKRLAMACRIVASQGWGIGCGMYLSSRDPVDPATIWVIPAGRALAAMKSSDLVQITVRDGRVIGDDAKWGCDVNSAALHRAIYAARPDVGAIIHGQTPHARSFSMQDLPLKMVVQDSCTFYKRIHRLPLKSSINALNDPRPVADALGSGKGLILENRGILVVGATIECPISYYRRLESLCHIQLAAEAAARGRGGQLVLIGDKEAQFSFENGGTERHAWFMAMPYFAQQDKLIGDDI